TLSLLFSRFFFNSTPTTRISPLSLHDALPILKLLAERPEASDDRAAELVALKVDVPAVDVIRAACDLLARDLAALNRPEFWDDRSEEHTSELQSLTNLVCRLLLEKKNKTQSPT